MEVPAHYVAMLTLLGAFAIKWVVKLVLLHLHRKEKIGPVVTIALTVVAFIIGYTWLHEEPPSPEAVILLGIFVLHLVKMDIDKENTEKENSNDE